MLYFTMIFNLNYGPFGKGGWFNDKRDWVLSFINESSPDSAEFRKYAPKIAKAHSGPLNT